MNVTQLDATMSFIQEHLRFKFHLIQGLCLNYLTTFQKRYEFLQFGIGNGKTLLCVVMALYYAKKSNSPVLIIGRNEYLVLRDCKKFSPLISSLGLESNVNQFSSQAGVFYMTMNKVTGMKKDKSFKQYWKQAIVIIDEYDWIIFDGTPDKMLHKLRLFRKVK